MLDTTDWVFLREIVFATSVLPALFSMAVHSLFFADDDPPEREADIKILPPNTKKLFRAVVFANDT